MNQEIEDFKLGFTVPYGKLLEYVVSKDYLDYMEFGRNNTGEKIMQVFNIDIDEIWTFILTDKDYYNLMMLIYKK